MRRAARWDGVVLQLLRSADEPTPEQVAEVAAWIAEERGRLRAEGIPLDGTFEIVVSGRLPADPAAAAARIEQLGDAGATWWVEAWWEPKDTPAALRERVRQGPVAG